MWFTPSPPSWETSVVFCSSRGRDCSSGEQKSCCERRTPRRTMAGVEALLRVARVTAWQWDEAPRRETCGPPVGFPAYTTSLCDNSWRAVSYVSGPTIKPHVHRPRFLCGPRQRLSGGGDPKATWSQQERHTTPDKAHGEAALVTVLVVAVAIAIVLRLGGGHHVGADTTLSRRRFHRPGSIFARQKLVRIACSLQRIGPPHLLIHQSPDRIRL